MLLDLFLWAVLTGFTLFSAGHALLNKRDPRAALIWIVLCFSLPGVGAASYWILGVNRIRTRARGWQEEGRGLPDLTPAYCDWSPEKSSILPFRSENFAGQLNLVDHVTRRPLVPGNFLQPLHDGEEAFPAMLNAIAGSKETICLSTYIFESNETGRRFTDALIRAAERGVEVRVLIDALGERYSFPSIRRLFRGSRVKVGRFLPPSLLGRGIFFNLRNHRKILVVDGNLGFVGGMNIGDRHLVDLEDNPRRVSDIHFAVFGPVIGHLEDAFNEDWHFATGEEPPARTSKELPPFGEAFARGISAGPNEEHEKLQWIIVGALNCARHSIRIMTPYFIPDR
ncbi:MAG: cardiolipin synthase, partial [Deltaproteobacteria bacterium]|nr:cardiolipin synthase [Deltaproteobacteria bacterium]